jgi:hypothetical protein
MSFNLELENPANWTIKDSQFFSTAPELLLPEYLSVNLTSNIIGVLVANGEALDTWNWAGWSCQQIQLPFGPSSNSSVNWRKLWLRQKQLLIFPKLVTTYKLFVRFPKWFKQVSVTVWEYTDPQIENTEN